LLVGGVTQSISLPDDDDMGNDDPRGDYWALMLPSASSPRDALLLGLGGGTVATLLARRCPTARMIGVERDAEVLTLARDLFGLERLPNLRIIEADAFDWMAAQFGGDSAPLEDATRYDLICVDLFEAGRLTNGVLATAFLRRVAALLAPGGVASFNLMVTGRTPEQLHRLRRVFTIERELRLRGNLVVHLTPLPREQWTTEARPAIM
ncbi:MAG TPA: class I SAM-dependent methyltransferase, partial [Ktedonobacterales bacterium]|nr:class I SAM-dependent methyltransferase [Ktedonobacterales bacterium]